MTGKRYFFFLLLLSRLTIMHDLAAQSIRPVRDPVGFCWDSASMKQLVNYLTFIEKEQPMPVVAGISPHDDYLYAARVYFPLYPKLRAKEVVIFGVTHGTVRKEIGDPKNKLIFESYDVWKGIGKPVPVSPLRKYIISKLDTSSFIIDNKAHQLEHSIEALLPFLQYYNQDTRITPIMVTAMDYPTMDRISGQLSRVLAGYIADNRLTPGVDIVFLISADANHYGANFSNLPFGDDAAAHGLGTRQDKNIADSSFSGVLRPEMIEYFTNAMPRVVWCGKYSIPMGLLTAMKTVRTCTGKPLQGKILRYSDTFTEGVLPIRGTEMGTTAPFSLKHWVGFLSAGFYLSN